MKSIKKYKSLRKWNIKCRNRYVIITHVKGGFSTIRTCVYNTIITVSSWYLYNCLHDKDIKDIYKFYDRFMEINQQRINSRRHLTEYE